MSFGLDNGSAAEIHPRAVASSRGGAIDTFQREERAFELVEGILADSFDQRGQRQA